MASGRCVLLCYAGQDTQTEPCGVPTEPARRAASFGRCGPAGDAGASPPALADGRGEVGTSNAAARPRRLSSAERDELPSSPRTHVRLRLRPGWMSGRGASLRRGGPGRLLRQLTSRHQPEADRLRTSVRRPAEGGCLLRRVESAAARTTSRLPAGSRRMSEAVSAIEPEGRRAASLRRSEGETELGEGDWRLRSYSAVAPKDREGRSARGSPRIGRRKDRETSRLGPGVFGNEQRRGVGSTDTARRSF